MPFIYAVSERARVSRQGYEMLEARVERQPEPTVQTADMWAKYFEEQWRPWLAPLGPRTPLSQLAEGTAARVAGFLAVVVGGPIAWLYASNFADHAEPVHALVSDRDDIAA